jgi:hypothetical protein
MKTNALTLAFAWLLFFPSFLIAQENNWRVFLEQLAEEADEGAINETMFDNMYEDLLQFESNPMNLNTVTREQLERFPLISLEEANRIAVFLERNRPIFTVYELRNVHHLDFQTVERILPFFFVGESDEAVRQVTIREMLRRGRNELQFRFDKTLTPRAGYGEFSDSILQRFPNRQYQGEDFFTSLRYSFRYRDKIQFGFTAVKNPGEPFLKTNHPKGFDQYGFHFIIRDVGRLRTLAVGDYRLSFGQGLILNNDFMVNKAWATDNIVRRTLPPKRHFSTAKHGFFRGAAAQFALTSDWSVIAFYSNRGVDANLNAADEITSFKTDGLRRTLLDISKKNNTREQVTGANINYRKEGFQIGVSALYHSWNRMLNPTLRLDNMYFLRDSSHVNASIDYSYRYRRMVFAGEAGIAKNGAVAKLNTLQYKPSSSTIFTVLWRHYPVSYNAMYARAFGETSRVQNEKGLFLGAKFTPFRRFSVNSYADFVRFPWLRYGVNTPSGVTEYFISGTYAFSRQSSVEARYRYKQRDRNVRYPNDRLTSVLPATTQKFRLRYNHNLQSGWQFRTTADFAHYGVERFPTEFGYMISQNIGYRGNERMTGDFYFGYFNADSHDVRLFSYERNLLNTFFMPSFHGKGYRVALSARYHFSSRLSLSIKGSQTRYFNRDTIGSGTELIDGNSRTDLFTYLRWRF